LVPPFLLCDPPAAPLSAAFARAGARFFPLAGVFAAALPVALPAALGGIAALRPLRTTVRTTVDGKRRRGTACPASRPASGSGRDCRARDHSSRLLN